ncbi:hypothetical protein KJ359_002427 [Pestalotiopsis sp. 9143b]|nr:hypothetical protein KJ359_002427 [Pestalotiopsis sp. 9143b]
MQDGLMLDVRGLDSISLSSDRQSATIGGGVSGGNLIDFLDQHGLVTPTGYCNTVGYVGWATGGGYGVLAGPYGLGVDQILGATLVDATGNLVDTDSDPHLLWALRGAGTGNFGVIVSMRVRVYERPPYLGGMILFPASEIGQVMSGLRQVTEETGSPDEFSGDCSMGQMPGLGAVFAIIFSWAQRHVVHGDDSLKRAREVLKRCEELGTVLLNTVQESESNFQVAL